MFKTIACTAFFVFIAGIGYAETPGDHWNKSTRINKVSFTNGYLSAILVTRMNIDILMQKSPNDPELTVLRGLVWSDVGSPDQLVDVIDDYYRDAANRHIPVGAIAQAGMFKIRGMEMNMNSLRMRYYGSQ